MITQHDTLIRRFWSYAFSTPNNKAVILKAKPGTARIEGAHGSEPFLCAIDWQTSGTAVAAIMAFLRANGFKSGDRAAILAWNCPEWDWCDLAIQSLGGVTVPIYPHSAADQVNFIAQNADAKFVFSNENEQLQKVSGTKAVSFDKIPAAIEPRLASDPRPFLDWFRPYVKLGHPEEVALRPETWQAVKDELETIKLQLQREPKFFCNLSSDQIATIIYTSGSTGTPKGVALTHGNIASACRALTDHGFSQDPEQDLNISYLPKAHVYERVDGAAMSIWHGVASAYCKVDEVGEALKLYHPTIMLGVPAVWRKIKEKIEANLNAATGVKRWLINWALTAKNPGWKRKLADFLVFKKIRNELGGCLRIMLSGGAPISPDVLEFFNLIGLELLQGYGLTETSGGISTNRPNHNKVGSVGQVVPGTDVAIVPKPGQEKSGEGEIQIRGPLVFEGYWMLPAENEKAFADGRWFKTGDLGRIDSEGYLFITGREKRLLKTDGGKYVAPEKIEKSFEGDALVQYIVPVGDGKPFISGLIFLNQQVARERLGRAIPADVNAAEYLANQPEILAAVQAAVTSANSKLERWETLKKVHVLPLEATVVSGLLTPTLKIRTEEVLKRYKNEIDSFYRAPKA